MGDSFQVTSLEVTAFAFPCLWTLCLEPELINWDLREFLNDIIRKYCFDCQNGWWLYKPACADVIIAFDIWWLHVYSNVSMAMGGQAWRHITLTLQTIQWLHCCKVDFQETERFHNVAAINWNGWGSINRLPNLWPGMQPLLNHRLYQCQCMVYHWDIIYIDVYSKCHLEWVKKCSFDKT